MLISTVPLTIENIPVIYVSPFPSKLEISKISSSLSNINENEKTFSIAKYRDFSLLDQHIQNDFLFVQQEKENRKDILDQLIHTYEKFDLVYPKFQKSIYDRESQWSTELFTGVAIPHANPSTVKTTTISFYA